jgi:hypothetical protein
VLVGSRGAVSRVCRARESSVQGQRVEDGWLLGHVMTGWVESPLLCPFCVVLVIHVIYVGYEIKYNFNTMYECISRDLDSLCDLQSSRSSKCPESGRRTKQ